MTPKTDNTDATMTRRTYLALAGGTTVVGTGLAGCTGTSGGGETETTTEAEGDAWTTDLDADREFRMVMGDVAHRDSFFPSTVFVEQGEQVGIHLKNTGDEPHDFEIPAFDVAAEGVAAGSATTRTFTADTVGVQHVECELHPQWMWGQLVVLPDAGTEIPTTDDRKLRMVTGDVAERDSFFPSTNVVVEGEEVSVQLKNTGDEPHDFEIPAFDVAREGVGPDTRVDDFSFTADAPGVHDVKCELHPEWMWGQLVVLPADGDYSRISADDAQKLRLVMGDVAGRESFFPSTNVVKKGEQVEMKLKNTGEELHDLDIEAFDVEVEVEAGKTKSVSFTADEAGLHEMVCELHPPEMNGQLWVVP